MIMACGCLHAPAALPTVSTLVRRTASGLEWWRRRAAGRPAGPASQSRAALPVGSACHTRSQRQQASKAARLTCHARLGSNGAAPARRPGARARGARREEADGGAARAGARGAPDAVHVVLRGLRQVVVDHQLDVLDICEQEAGPERGSRGASAGGQGLGAMAPCRPLPPDRVCHTQLPAASRASLAG